MLPEGDAVGEAVYKLNGTRIGSVSILAAKGVEKAQYKDYYKKVWGLYLMKKQNRSSQIAAKQGV